MLALLLNPQYSFWIGILVAAIVLWTLPWKAYALWIAARNNHPWWFIILLVVNTLAILEIVYIFRIGIPEMRRRKAESPAGE